MDGLRAKTGAANPVRRSSQKPRLAKRRPPVRLAGAGPRAKLRSRPQGLARVCSGADVAGAIGCARVRPQAGGGGARGSPAPPLLLGPGRQLAPSPQSAGARNGADGSGRRELGQGEEGAAGSARALWPRARAETGARRARRGEGEGGGVGAALSQAVAGAASLLPF